MQNLEYQIYRFSEEGNANSLRALRRDDPLVGRAEASAENNAALRVAATGGHWEVLNFLRRGFGLTDEDARANNNEALQSAALNGDVDVLNELHAYGLDADDAREANALEIAADSGHADFLRALRERFGLTDDDARENENSALINSAFRGHTDVLRVLRDVYGLDEEDARDQNNQALILAAQEGHVDVLAELRNGFGLSTDDARARNNAALRGAASNRRNGVVLYLLYGFGLTIQDAASERNAALAAAVQGRNGELVRILRRFQTQTEEERRRDQIRYGFGEDEAAAAPAAAAAPLPPAFDETQTESIRFEIAPPLEVDYNLETSRCFDLIDFDLADAKDYLQRDPDNIIIINLSTRKALCFTKESLSEYTRDLTSQFVECLGETDVRGDRSLRYIRPDARIYLRIPADESGMNAFLPLENVSEAVSSRERIFCLVPLKEADTNEQASLTHTITVQNLRGPERDFVSANHCQRGSNVLLYKFVKCRFAGIARAPSWTLAPLK